MDIQKAAQYLSQDESPTLEFKQEWYTDEDKSQAKLKKNEMVRDILSLANGNASTAGQDAYLILGAADQKTTRRSEPYLIYQMKYGHQPKSWTT